MRKNPSAITLEFGKFGPAILHENRIALLAKIFHSQIVYRIHANSGGQENQQDV
jgi:hypothetical protein